MNAVFFLSPTLSLSLFFFFFFLIVFSFFLRQIITIMQALLPVTLIIIKRLKATPICTLQVLQVLSRVKAVRLTKHNTIQRRYIAKGPWCTLYLMFLFLMELLNRSNVVQGGPQTIIVGIPKLLAFVTSIQAVNMQMPGVSVKSKRISTHNNWCNTQQFLRCISHNIYVTKILHKPTCSSKKDKLNSFLMVACNVFR